MGSDLARFKEEQRQQWSRAAGPWQRWHEPFSQMTREATVAIVTAAELAEGMKVLDLASGTGEPALTIAGLVGPSGSVVASDLVAEMVGAVEENARRRGLTNVTCQQIDAEEIPLPDATFGRVTCRFGVMFFPDTARALGEIHRVLRPGGLAVFTAWAPPELNPFFSSVSEVLGRYGLLTPPPPDAPGVFRFAKPGSLSAAMEGAGFRQVSEGQRRISWRWPGSLDEFWEWWQESTPFRRAIENAEPDRRRAVLDDLRTMLQQLLVGEQVDFGGATIVLAAGVR